MGAGILVSLDEYLDTACSPDREYVDGAIVERNVGERAHGIVQSNVIFALRREHPEICVWPEVRVRTVGSRSRLAPEKKKAFTFTDSRLNEIATQELITESPEIRPTFAEIFRGL
jgi:hypothetical protein